MKLDDNPRRRGATSPSASLLERSVLRHATDTTWADWSESIERQLIDCTQRNANKQAARFAFENETIERRPKDDVRAPSTTMLELFCDIFYQSASDKTSGERSTVLPPYTFIFDLQTIVPTT